MRQRWKRILLPGIFIALGLFISILAPTVPRLIEKGYSRSFFFLLSQGLSSLTGLLPFSLAEFMVIGLIALLLYKIVTVCRTLIANPRQQLQIWLRGLPKLVGVILLVFISFNMLWGLNYHRQPFAQIVALPVEATTDTEELKKLALYLTEQANELRSHSPQDKYGVFTLPNGVREMLGRADLGYQQAAVIYPQLGGSYGPPKPVLLSRLWSYTGISGAYFPFTAEANVNIDMPHVLMPATASHEMAHQRGFAREDEANFIAYLTCTLHPDKDFQYSGTFLALNYTMNALYQANPEAYAQVRSLYSSGVDRDAQAWSSYWRERQGPVSQISNRINDTYLRTNRQQHGVQSYGHMVDLLLAHWQANR